MSSRGISAFLFVIAVSLVALACQPAEPPRRPIATASEPQATATPYSTYTPLPTDAPVPTWTPYLTYTTLPTGTPLPTPTPTATSGHESKHHPREWEWAETDGMVLSILQAADYAVVSGGELSRETGIRPAKRPAFLVSQFKCGIKASIVWQTPLFQPSKVTMMTGTATGRAFQLDGETKTVIEWDLADDGMTTYYPGGDLWPYAGNKTVAFLNSFKDKTQMGALTERAGVGIGNGIMAWFDISQMEDAVKRVMGTCE